MSKGQRSKKRKDARPLWDAKSERVERERFCRLYERCRFAGVPARDLSGLDVHALEELAARVERVPSR